MGLTALAVPSIVAVARHKGLYGTVREKKPDLKEIPTLGGVAIFAGTTVSMNLFVDPVSMPELPYLLAGILIVFLIGLRDDILFTKPIWKLTGQSAAALVLVAAGGLRIADPGSFFGLELNGGFPEIFFTVFLMVGVINSYNLIDGIDGLASGTGMLSALVFGLVFYGEGMYEWAMMAGILTGSLAAFTWFNVFGRRNKILMGDTGSLMLGFMLSAMAVRFLKLDSPRFLNWQISDPLAFSLSVLLVPLFDTLRIILIRIYRGQSPLHPDRKHIHYRLIDTGFTHLQASGLLISFNLAMIVLAVVLQGLGEPTLLLILLGVPGLLSFLPGIYLKKRRKQKQEQS